MLGFELSHNQIINHNFTVGSHFALLAFFVPTIANMTIYMSKIRKKDNDIVFPFEAGYAEDTIFFESEVNVSQPMTDWGYVTYVQWIPVKESMNKLRFFNNLEDNSAYFYFLENKAYSYADFPKINEFAFRIAKSETNNLPKITVSKCLSINTYADCPIDTLTQMPMTTCFYWRTESGKACNKLLTERELILSIKKFCIRDEMDSSSCNYGYGGKDHPDCRCFFVERTDLFKNVTTELGFYVHPVCWHPFCMYRNYLMASNSDAFSVCSFYSKNDIYSAITYAFNFK